MSPIFYKENNKMNCKRKLANDRRREILAVALTLSSEVGYMQLTRRMIAERIGLTEQAVQHHIGTMDNLRRDVMRAAVREECLPVIGQGLAYRDPYAMKADPSLKQSALEALGAD